LFNWFFLIISDLKRTRLHLGINATTPSEHPIRTLNPMRLLAAAAHLNEEMCVPLTHKLFGAYWVYNKGTVLIIKRVGKLMFLKRPNFC